LDCRAKFETKLKLEGKWEAYLIDMHNKEIDQTIEEYKSYIEDTLSESNNNYVTEDGDVQKWVGGIDKVRAMAAMEETINYLNSLKK
jgi:uncharacterized protein (DUF1330 family)